MHEFERKCEGEKKKVQGNDIRKARRAEHCKVAAFGERFARIRIVVELVSSTVSVTV